MTTTSLPTVFSEIAKASTKKQKKELLLKYDCFALQQILKAAFDPNIKFLLPPGAPPIVKFQGDTDEPNPTYLHFHIRKLYLFVEGQSPKNLTDMKREKAFTDILEGIHPSEVELLLQVKDKKLKCRGLTFNLVKETFPNLLP